MDGRRLKTVSPPQSMGCDLRGMLRLPSLGTLNEDAVIECRRCVLGEGEARRPETCCCTVINVNPDSFS